MTQRLLWLLTLGGVAGTLGCSDPVPQASGVGLEFSVGVCATQDSLVKLGEMPPRNPVFSGETGTTVSCRVSASGAFFGNVSARSPRPLSFSVQGKVDPEEGIGTATISLNAGLASSVSQPFRDTDAPCNLEVLRTTTGLQFEEGAIWTRFSCSNLQAPPSTRCTATGQFTFQRCDN